MRYIFISLFSCVSFSLFSQSNGLKTMDISTFDIWNTIDQIDISNNGEWVSYTVKPGKGDKLLKLFETKTGKTFTFERAHSPEFDANHQFMAFKISPPLDSIEHLKRKKVKKEKLPSDTLAIFSFKERKIEKVNNVQQFSLGEEWGDYIFCHLKPNEDIPDSISIKKESKEFGSSLLIKNMKENTTDTIFYVKSFVHSKKYPRLAIHTTSVDSSKKDKVVMLDLKRNIQQTIFDQIGDYYDLCFSESGDNFAFISDVDTTDNIVRPYRLHWWQLGQKKSEILVDTVASILPPTWLISSHDKIEFSKNEDRLFFNIRPPAIQKDTSLLEEEIVNVEVWTSQDDLLYTQQNKLKDRETNRNYACMYDLKSKSFIQIENEEIRESTVSKKASHQYAVIADDQGNRQELSWLGQTANKVFAINLTNNKKEKIGDKIYGDPRLSPDGKFAFWYSRPDSSWYSYQFKTKKKKQFTTPKTVKAYDETNDRPMNPWNNGYAFWNKKDSFIYVYDHYDIWKVDPTKSTAPERITFGREKNTRYRYVSLDNDIDQVPADTSILIRIFNKTNKKEGIAKLNLETKVIDLIETGDVKYGRRFLKAKNSDELVYTKESIDLFPDYVLSNIHFEKREKFTNINPQQSEYKWLSNELISWESYNGDTLQGMLFFPEPFDPDKKYPVIVNFYEKSSDRLNSHRAPFPHRSTINYSYYANRGYIIFNPDILYRTAEPGQSCYDAVMSGVDEIVKRPYIDKAKMALQGHSWGGYQIADLITKTNRFICAESGAPVVNMISAYGGIRWRTGMSRMFQYERTQSRLGTTLWEDPQRYIDNSPIFKIDKIETPVLIMHNDKDGAVPWYQGIEFFTALRRLGKEAWFLNYNDEPHWPLKRQNRVDFNLRMQQFFDYYCQNKGMPSWMKNGVSPLQKGIQQGYEIID